MTSSHPLHRIAVRLWIWANPQRRGWAVNGDWARRGRQLFVIVVHCKLLL